MSGVSLSLINPPCTRLTTVGCRIDDGKMRTDLREYALEKIKTSTTTKIILISFKAGSTGVLILVGGRKRDKS